MPSGSAEITQLLESWRKGDKQALDRIITLVHQELKRLARGLMRGERQGHTLQTSALVNEAYLRLVDAPQVQWQDRNHFFSIAARTMRRILVDHAREQRAAKRGGGAVKTEWQDQIVVPGLPDADLVDLDLALSGLEKLDRRKCKLVELRFFAGLTNKEAAQAMGCSLATVKREWDFARTWLHRQMNADA